MAQISRQKQEWISEKIKILRHEGYPQRQAIAIAYNMAGVSRRQTGSSRSPERSSRPKTARLSLSEAAHKAGRDGLLRETFFSLDDSQLQQLDRLMRQTKWRQARSSQALGRGQLRAFHSALRRRIGVHRAPARNQNFRDRARRRRSW